MKKTDFIKNEILDRIGQCDVAGYLKDELGKSLSYFHYYKLNNIYKNIDFLVDYLMFLDQKNSNQLSQLNYDEGEKCSIGDHNINYYISGKGLELVGKDKIIQKIVQNDFGLNSIMLGLKGFLLLTIDEFCNATPVRLSIDKILLTREKNLC